MNLPNEIRQLISLNLPYEDIVTVCQTNKSYHSGICDSQYFWQQLYIRDFGQPVTLPKNWKEAYLSGNLRYDITNLEIDAIGKYRQIIFQTSYMLLLDTDNNLYVAQIPGARDIKKKKLRQIYTKLMASNIAKIQQDDNNYFAY